MAVVGLLIAFRPDGMTFHGKDAHQELLKSKKKVFLAGFVWLLLAVPSVYAMTSVQKNAIAELGTEFIGADGRKTILLEPEKWLGKELPLFSRFTHPSGVEKIKQDDWTAILIHADCPKCIELLKEIESLPLAKNVAIIAVSTHTNDSITQLPFLLFQLDTKNDWFVTTPCVLKLANGVCIELSDHIK